MTVTYEPENTLAHIVYPGARLHTAFVPEGGECLEPVVDAHGPGPVLPLELQYMGRRSYRDVWNPKGVCQYRPVHGLGDHQLARCYGVQGRLYR